MSLKYIKSGGIKIYNSLLPAVGGGLPPVNTGGGGTIVPYSGGPSPIESIGAASVALGLMQWMDSVNIPNPYTFVKDPIMYGFTKPSDENKAAGYQNHWDKTFRTLGNGSFELNDILAFPVNWGVFLIDKIAEKAINKNKKKDPNNTNNNNNNEGSNGNNNNGNNNNNNGGPPYAR